MQITRRLSSDSSIEDTGLKFPHPPKSSNLPQKSISVHRPSSSSKRHGLSERRVQSGPKEHSNERKNDDSKQLRKSNSFGTIDRDIVSADSGVEGDIIMAGVYGRDSRSLSASNDSFNDSIELRTSNTSSDSNPRKSSLSELRASCKYENNENSNNIVDGGGPDSLLPYDASCDNQAVIFRDNVEPLLKQMELNYLHSDIEALSVNFDVLWRSLEICGLLVKANSSGSARRRTTVLRTIFKFVDIENSVVILKLCKVALVVRNFSLVCFDITTVFMFFKTTVPR